MRAKLLSTAVVVGTAVITMSSGAATADVANDDAATRSPGADRRFYVTAPARPDDPGFAIVVEHLPDPGFFVLPEWATERGLNYDGMIEFPVARP